MSIEARLKEQKDVDFPEVILDAHVALRSVFTEDEWQAMSAVTKYAHTRQLVLNVLAHEVDEWLALDGIRYGDPHKHEVKRAAPARYFDLPADVEVI